MSRPRDSRDPVDSLFGVLPAFITINVLGASLVNRELGWSEHSPSSALFTSVVESVEAFQVQLPYAIHAVLMWAQTESASRFLLSVAGLYLAWLLARHLLLPTTYMRGVTEVQFDGCASQLKARPYEAMLRRGRKLGDMPKPFPNGWFFLCFSHELKRGDVRQVNCLGHSLVLFRGKNSGQASVVDAYCPHLGANLAVGGEVKGDCIECPFHGWKFEGQTGQCTDIPYTKGSIPSNANTKAWTVSERSDMIMVWHDAEGREPTFPPLSMDEVDEGGFRFHGKTEHIISNVLRDIPENGFDPSHLGVLHEPFIIPSMGGLFKHQWEASCVPHPEIGHATLINILEKVCLFGRPLTFLDVKVVVNQWGPGTVVLRMKLPLGEVVIVENVTPVEPMLLKATHAIWAPWYLPRFVAKLVLKATAVQFERDVPIWSNKVSMSKPVLVPEDRTIKEFRRWWSQFESEHSLTFEEAVQEHVKMDW